MANEPWQARSQCMHELNSADHGLLQNSSQSFITKRGEPWLMRRRRDARLSSLISTRTSYGTPTSPEAPHWGGGHCHCRSQALPSSTKSNIRLRSSIPAALARSSRCSTLQTADTPILGLAKICDQHSITANEEVMSYYSQLTEFPMASCTCVMARVATQPLHLQVRRHQRYVH